MRSNTFRGAFAVILSVALLSTVSTQAQGNTTPTPKQFTGPPTSELPGLVETDRVPSGQGTP